MINITILDINYSFSGSEDTIHPVVLDTGHGLILVDTAFTGFLPRLEQAMRDKGLDCADLTHVIISHQDHDHMSALAELKHKYPSVLVVAGEDEVSYISGARKSLRLEQAEKLQPLLPSEQREFGESFMRVLRAVEPVEVDIIVRGGDAPDWLGDGRIIATPGHTPGHISILLEEEDTIIAGDAAVAEDGKLSIANPVFTLDMEQADRSLSIIKKSGVKNIICFHGGFFRNDN